MFELAPIVGRHGLQGDARGRGLQNRESLCEGLPEVAASYPAVKGWDPVGRPVQVRTRRGRSPGARWLARYAKEKGIEVPKRFLPPEVKK